MSFLTVILDSQPLIELDASAAALNHDRLLRTATDLVDVMTSSAEDYWTPAARGVDVIASVDDCLHIGLPLLGRAPGRTIEAGERRPSPLTLYPFRASDGDVDEGSVAALRELYESGAFEFATVDAAKAEWPRSLGAAIASYKAQRRSEGRMVWISDSPAVRGLFGDIEPITLRASAQFDKEKVIDAIAERMEETTEEYTRAEQRRAIEMALQLEFLLSVIDRG